MSSSSEIRYYTKQIKKQVQNMNRLKKRMIVVGAGMLIFGLVAGNSIGHSVEKKKSEKKLAQVTEKIKKEEQKKLEEMEKELESIQNQEEKELPWNLVLVNNSHPMPEGYVPELTEITPGYSVDSRIADPLREMLAAAKAEGLNILVCSAYRSVEKQIQVFNSSVQERLNSGMNYWKAYEDTSLSVAIPGKSEHGMGLSVDLISNKYTELDEKQAETPEAKWLEKNCYKYGFILRYPPSKTAETGIIYEPWHYRYVGKKDAKKIMEADTTLERYLYEEY